MKNFFYKYKTEIIEAYMAAAVFFTCMSAGLNPWISAVILGIANTYLVVPLVNAINFGNNTEDRDVLEFNLLKFTKNLFTALFITTIMIVMYYYINEYLFPTYVEPISFGIIYKLIDIGLGKIAKFFRKFIPITNK